MAALCHQFRNLNTLSIHLIPQILFSDGCAGGTAANTVRGDETVLLQSAPSNDTKCGYNSFRSIRRFGKTEIVRAMKAILSDIHGNLEALEAVLADIARHAVEAIYCLGDTLGYGPNPRECLDAALNWNVVLLGSMDYAVSLDPADLGPSAAAANRSLAWSRKELNVAVPDRESVARRWRFLAERPREHRNENLLLVHGSPRNPLHEYVYPEDIFNRRKMERVFACSELRCFNGHTHVPGIFTEDRNFLSPEDLDGDYRFDHCKTIVNVGSVGQPRDGDWRACYVLLDGDAVRFRRVEYDVETTIRKLKDINDRDDFSGDRLGDGH